MAAVATVCVAGIAPAADKQPAQDYEVQFVISRVKPADSDDHKAKEQVRLLAQPTLKAALGHEAAFQSGEEIRLGDKPIPFGIAVRLTLRRGTGDKELLANGVVELSRPSFRSEDSAVVKCLHAYFHCPLTLSKTRTLTFPDSPEKGDVRVKITVEKVARKN